MVDSQLMEEVRREEPRDAGTETQKGPTKSVLEDQTTPSPSLDFVKQNIDVLRTMIKEHDRSAGDTSNFEEVHIARMPVIPIGLWGFFEKQRLTGPNFIDWYRQLRIALSVKDKLNYLEHPIPAALVPAQAGQQVAPDAHAAHAAWVKGSKEIVQKGNKQHKKPQSQSAARGHNQGKGKNKLAYVPKPKIPPLPKREDPDKDSVCHQYGYIGHWKRNYPQYLAELLKNMKLSQGASGSGIFTIELYTFPNKSWVYDVGYDTHIYNTTQGLKGSRKLKPGALSLYVGNGQRAAVQAIRTYYLSLPSELVIVLNNCHYAPSITRGIISVSHLYNDGYVNQFVNNSIQVSMNNMVYFSAFPQDGIFEIDLSNSYTNVSSIYALRNKRSKSNLDFALLWHCLLGHISKKHIEKLQHDVLLNSTDLRAFAKCVSCMSGKMARKPYTHQVERDKDLLGLIHTDVCGPFKIMSRQGASYFVTFTNDFSRYGYVYLFKHKHEVFETFKVFQEEVENQLGKTIKSLRSNHRGEYMSHEFLDHLKDYGIIAHRTPPYTPQYNGVSERRNRTLLDMVEKIPYEVCHGQALELSYLKVWGCKELVKQDTLTKPGKLEPMSIKCIFIGYPKETIGYSFYYLPENKDDLDIDEPQSDIIPIRRSTRTRHAPERMCLYIDAEEHELGDLGEPSNYKADLESDKWLNAMNVEMQSMKDNEKTDMDGAVHTYKARFVAKGYTQTHVIDYEETFSHVADIRAIRILIAIAAFYDYEIWQMNVKTAFLNVYLSKEVFRYEDLGEAAYTLGIKIYRDRSWRLIVMCQSAYIEKILKRYHMENSKHESIPMQDKPRLSKSQGASTPAELKRMQNVPYASSIKPEYIAAFDASKEAVWVRKFISGLGVVPTIKEPISMYCDNTRAITIANESGITKGARHFHAKVHYLHEVIKYGDVKLEKVHTYDNLSDLFTKAFGFPKHSEHTKNIGMLPASSLILSRRDKHWKSIYISSDRSRTKKKNKSDTAKKPRDVTFKYKGYNDIVCNTEVMLDYSCAFCYLACLKCHLQASHDLFDYEFQEEEEYKVVNVSYNKTVVSEIWQTGW
uniref:Integrase catalytic domain-containing protein n=1 Tax=Tanacetum cinerariifolium TaxID=118510 RepID=A0A6L2N1E7_TANCI|nr:hypothetical protein [Tanacetum cinerariifolium]